MEPHYELVVYEDESGWAPFEDWFLSLRDTRAQAKIQLRLDRISFGNFGDWKSIKGIEGLRELRDPSGPGYRIYYSIQGKRIVLLLAGSTKKDQAKAIARAGKYLNDYKRRAADD